jgi:hypothetical protein
MSMQWCPMVKTPRILFLQVSLSVLGFQILHFTWLIYLAVYTWHGNGYQTCISQMVDWLQNAVCQTWSLGSQSQGGVMQTQLRRLTYSTPIASRWVTISDPYNDYLHLHLQHSHIATPITMQTLIGSASFISMCRNNLSPWPVTQNRCIVQ